MMSRGFDRRWRMNRGSPILCLLLLLLRLRWLLHWPLRPLSWRLVEAAQVLDPRFVVMDVPAPGTKVTRALDEALAQLPHLPLVALGINRPLPV